MNSNFIKEIQRLNDIETFLKEFLKRHPEYLNRVIGKSEQEYEFVRKVMIREWKSLRKGPCPFENITYKVKDNVFIPQKASIGVTTNLRYMPLILHTQEFIVVNYVLKSNGSVYIDLNDTFELQDGDVIITTPNVYNTFNTQNDESIIIDIFLSVAEFDSIFLGLMKDDSVLSKLFSKSVYGTANGYILWHCKEDLELENQIIAIYKEWNNNNKYRSNMINALVVQFFIILLRNHEEEAIFPKGDSKENDGNALMILNYLQTHYKDVSLHKVAQIFNYSDRQLIRLIKRSTGKTFSALMQEIRMKQAVNMMENSDMAINEISAQLGYKTTSYFSKVFKETYKILPCDYRKNLINH